MSRNVDNIPIPDDLVCGGPEGRDGTELLGNACVVVACILAACVLASSPPQELSPLLTGGGSTLERNDPAPSTSGTLSRGGAVSWETE